MCEEVLEQLKVYKIKFVDINILAQKQAIVIKIIKEYLKSNCLCSRMFGIKCDNCQILEKVEKYR